jgi:hypothetical protein
MPHGIPCRMGYHAVRDTMPRGIPCRMGYHAAWDASHRHVYCKLSTASFLLPHRTFRERSGHSCVSLSSLPLSAAAARVGTQSTCVCEYSVVPCEYGLHSLHRKIALPAAGAYSVAVFSWPSTTQKVHCSHTAPRRTNRTQIPFKARAETTRNPPLSSLLSESVGVGRGRHLQGRLR